MHPIAPHLPGPYLGARTGQTAPMDGHDLVRFFRGCRRVDSDTDGPSLWRWFPGYGNVAPDTDERPRAEHLDDMTCRVSARNALPDDPRSRRTPLGILTSLRLRSR